MAAIPTHETHTLNVPITHQGRDYTELRLRRPRVKDILRSVQRDEKGLADDVKQIVDLAEVPPDVVHDLDISDLYAVQAIMRSFATPAEADVRKAVMLLSVAVGWDLDSLEERPVEDIIEWLATLKAIRPRG